MNDYSPLLCTPRTTLRNSVQIHNTMPNMGLLNTCNITNVPTFNKML